MIRILAVALLLAILSTRADATTVTLATGREIGFDQVEITLSPDSTQIVSGLSAMKLAGGAIARIVTPNFRLYQTRLDKATAERAAFSEKVTTLTAQLEAAKQRIADVEKDRERLRNAVSDDDNKIMKLTRENEALRRPKPKPTPTPATTPSFPKPSAYTPAPTFAPPRSTQTPAAGAARTRTPAAPLPASGYKRPRAGG